MEIHAPIETKLMIDAHELGLQAVQTFIMMYLAHHNMSMRSFMERKTGKSSLSLECVSSAKSQHVEYIKYI